MSTIQTLPVTPYLTVGDAAGAIAFYQKAFGATLGEHHLHESGRTMHAHLGFPEGGSIMLSDDFPEFHGHSRTPLALGSTPVTIHLCFTPNTIDRVWADAVAAGATITMPLEKQFWGDKYGRLKDPFGHEWSLSAPTS